MTVSGDPPSPFMCMRGTGPLCLASALRGDAQGTHHHAGTWASRLLQPIYSLGELMNVEASVSAGPILPVRVFVDECEATPSAGPRYKVIDNG